MGEIHGLKLGLRARSFISTQSGYTIQLAQAQGYLPSHRESAPQATAQSHRLSFPCQLFPRSILVDRMLLILWIF